jgi:uncharacterized protein
MIRKGPSPYTNPYVAGIGLGLVLLASFLMLGRGLGASGAMTRLTLYSAYKAEASVHGGTQAEEAARADQNSYMARYVGEGQTPLEDFLVYLFAGVLLGGFVSGLAGGRFSFEVIRGPNASVAMRLFLAGSGGLVSAYGARLARGCTSGQALTGGATLAVGSWAFMLAVFAGGYALAWFLRKEWT